MTACQVVLLVELVLADVTVEIARVLGAAKVVSLHKMKNAAAFAIFAQKNGKNKNCMLFNLAVNFFFDKKNVCMRVRVKIILNNKKNNYKRRIKLNNINERHG